MLEYTFGSMLLSHSQFKANPNLTFFAAEFRQYILDEQETVEWDRNLFIFFSFSFRSLIISPLESFNCSTKKCIKCVIIDEFEQ